MAPSTLLWILFSLAPSADHEVVVPFPFEVTEVGDDGSLELAATEGSWEPLATHDSILLNEVSLTDGAQVDLVLERVDLDIEASRVDVNGQVGSFEDVEDLTLWSGHVVGETESSVYLALSKTSSWGWVRRLETTHHLLWSPRDTGEGHGGQRWIREDQLEARDQRLAFRCQAEQAQEAAPDAEAITSHTSHQRGESPTPLLACPLAVETDWQFYEVFSDLTTAKKYTIALVGGLNVLYRKSLGVLLIPAYFGFHTDPDDPWERQDGPLADCVLVLDEFWQKWTRRPPVRANVYHMLSGADMHCGAAFLGTVCAPPISFGVTGDVNGQSTFPPDRGPLMWDYYVMAHEIGHNFGALHTHDYCPPLDECAPEEYWGTCQDEVTCQVGTVMSYCYFCDGGTDNIAISFHPSIQEILRARVERCLLPFEGLLSEDLGHGSPGERGVPGQKIGYDAQEDELVVVIDDVPPGSIALYVASDEAIYEDIPGGLLVPTLEWVFSLPTGSEGQVRAKTRIKGSYPEGFVFYTQALVLDTEAEAGYSMSQAMRAELIRP